MRREKSGTVEKNSGKGRVLVLLGLSLFVFYCSWLVVAYYQVIDPFGDRTASIHYLDLGAIETYSTNLVNSIVWDYRGYDTLGEETVLFVAIVGVALVSRAMRENSTRRMEVDASP